MESPFSLLGGQHQYHVLQKAADYLETTHFPEVLSEAIEELLVKQVLHTVNQVERMLMSEGYVVGQLAIEAEKLVL